MEADRMTRNLGIFILALSLMIGCGSSSTTDPGNDQGGEDTTVSDTGSDQGGEDTPPVDTGNDEGGEDTPPVDTGSDQGGEDTPPGDQGSDTVDSDVDELPEGACTAETPCEDQQESCVGPETQLCGVCYQPDETCQSDGDCTTPGTVCSTSPVVCACEGNTYECVEACTTDEHCGGDMVCDAGGHCVPPPCSDSSECEPNFVCDGSCVRQSCQSSSECAGYCVTGICSADPGYCSPPVP